MARTKATSSASRGLVAKLSSRPSMSCACGTARLPSTGGWRTSSPLCSNLVLFPARLGLKARFKERRHDHRGSALYPHVPARGERRTYDRRASALVEEVHRAVVNVVGGADDPELADAQGLQQHWLGGGAQAVDGAAHVRPHGRLEKVAALPS